MDGSRFDNFVRDLALRRTRREALKSFVGAVAGVASSATIASQIDAKQKPKKCKYQGYSCQTNVNCCTLNCCNRVCCGEGQICVNGQCVLDDPCTPTTCEAEGVECGSVPDGCGGTITCGPPCVCEPGNTQPCYSGPAGTEGVGICRAGTETCLDDGTGYGACVGEIVPEPELCDGLDNDCDGVIDEDNPGGGQACNTGLPGICAAGTTQCVDGSLTCVQNQQPQAEICDGLDNDCDGVIDDGNPGGGQACNTGLPGICAAGTTQCVGGSLTCVQNQQPRAEICNGLDDDCDGQIDEGNPGGGAPCNTGLPGICAQGTVQCQGGVLMCVQNQFPLNEVCNGVDDNCNGIVDDGVVCPGGQICQGGRCCYPSEALVSTCSLCCSGNCVLGICTS